MKYTLRIPSKSIQYGYVEAILEGEFDYFELGKMYHNLVVNFQSGEAEAKSGPKVRVPKVEVALDPAELIKTELGATDITDIMNEETEEEAPEWEQPPPKPSDDDWDFS